MNNEFKKISKGDVTRYVLESGSSGGTSSGSVASVSMPMGGTRRRGDNLIAQEADSKTVPTSTPRNFVAKNAKSSGAGAHKDKKKAAKQGQEKHKKPFMEDHTTASGGWGQGSYDTYTAGRHGRGVAEDERDHPDHEIQMASSELMSIAKNAEELLDMVRRYSEQEGLDAWQQSKITKAADYLNSVLQSINGEQQGVAEDFRDEFRNQLDSEMLRSINPEKYQHQQQINQQDQEHELNIGAAGRSELKRQANALAEIKREKLRNERLQDEEVAFQRAETVQQRKDEMKKIADKYSHELTVIDKEHRNNMEAIRTGNNHEINKMSMEFQQEKDMWDRNNPQQRSQYNPENPLPEPEPDQELDQEPNDDNFDQDTGEPLKPGFTRSQQKPPQANQWHTSQQVGYKPTKPTKPSSNDDVIDVEPKPNKPLALKEKISVVRDPAQATGIHQTGGITAGSVYMPGKPLSRSDSKPNTSRAVDAKGRTQRAWIQAVTMKFPDAKIIQSKMIDGSVQANLADGRKLVWKKAEQGVAEEWSKKYKSSINCSHPKGFSQKAHCAGKKKHNESMMEMVCEDCGMCETHGDSMMEVKQRLDAKCWTGKHKEGTKIKGGVRVNNCVPNEDVEEGWNDIKKFGKKAAVAGAIGLGIGAAHAGGFPSDVPAGGHNQLPDIVAHIKFKVGDKEITKDINLGSHYRSPGEAGEELKNFLQSKGIKFYQYSLERVKPKDNDKIDNSPATSDMKGSMDTSEPAAKGPSTDNYMTKDNDPENGPSMGGKFVKEGAKVDRQAKHITASMMKKGKSKKDAESIAWAHIKHPKNESADTYLESLQTMMERQLEPNMELDTWIDNFQHADPQRYHQFKNKTPEKKK